MKIKFYTILLSLMVTAVTKADLTSVGFTNEALTVASSSDGLGNFTYAFTEGTNGLFEFKLQDIALQIDSSMITDIIVPSGWDTQIDPTIVQFSWTNSSPIDALNNTPIEFTIETSYTISSINTEGIAGFSTPLGFSKFDYIQPIPEPSTMSFMAISIFGIYLFRNRTRR